MATKRMFNLNIVNSARFLKMPIDAQNLYFHLNLRADDDGVVEAFTVMRQIGSNEDNLRVLHAKEFIKILNEDLVSYIMDWREHNSLRADRKQDSIYKDLLIQMLPDIQLLESKPRSDLKKNQDKDEDDECEAANEIPKTIIPGRYSLDGCETTIEFYEDKLGKPNMYEKTVLNAMERWWDKETIAWAIETARLNEMKTIENVLALLGKTTTDIL